VAGTLLPGSAPAAADTALADQASVIPTRLAGARDARPAAAQDLDVTLDSMSPSVIPRKGPIVMSGTVTNTTDDTLTDVNLHPLTSYSPMTTAREVEVSVESDPESFIGERIIAAGNFDSVPDLAPGATATWRIRVQQSALQISGEEGVYWIGVQALAFDSDGIREVRGRARSFIPLVRGAQKAVPTSILLPVRRSVQHTAQGRVSRADEWAAELDEGGRLANLTDFVRSSGTAPVTWLIDPAVLDAVRDLGAGNPERNLEPTQPAPGEEGDPDAADGDQAQGDQPEAADAGLPQATEWLASVRSLTARNPVLALPYGDIDAAAAARYEPSLYTRARAQSATVLDGMQIESTPALVPPSGLINPAALSLTPVDTQVFLSEEAIPKTYDDPADVPSSIDVAGRRIAITDHRVAVGGPGPDERTGMVALRQRILAEAAVRSLDGDTGDLVVDLPSDFDPGTDSSQFFRGLENSFVDVVPATVDRTGEAPVVDRVAYPTRQVVRELDQANFTAAQRMVEAGSRLDDVLVRNDTIGEQVLTEALCTVSYQQRDDPVTAQVSATDQLAWLTARLLRIRIEAPSFVILSAASGPFAVTVSNDLDQPVRMRIEAQTSDGIVIRAPEEISLEGETRQTVQLKAEAGSIGVHPVRLVATDSKGNPLGSVDELDIRSNTVSKVIWVILGAGVGILMLSIPMRWARRRRQKGQPSGGAA